jgi:L-fuconolactonase
LIVDAHQHFWNLDRSPYAWLGPDMAPIFRTIEADELEPHLRAAGVDTTVLVQADNSAADTAYLLEVADKWPWVGAVVGWVPLDEPEEAQRRLEVLTCHPKFRGVRHLMHDEADADWIVRDRVLAGLEVIAAFGLPFDVVAVFPNHLRHVPTLASRIPDLTMVIDHLAKPPIRTQGWEPWAAQLREAAACPRVFAKVSGLNTAADPERWQVRDLAPYVDWAISCFGSDRLMFGSDWPVLELAGDYARVWAATEALLADLGQGERAAILGGTAERVYGPRIG